MGGVLPVQALRDAVARGVIKTGKYAFEERQLQPASVDLRLGETAFALRSSFLPDRETVQTKLDQFAVEELDLRRGAVLSPRHPYLIPLMESLRLPPPLRARANPRSSTGRLDIFTRVVSDKGFQFDEIAAGYRGPLYLEVFSRTFSIRVETGLSLNQIRLMRGPAPFALSDEKVIQQHAESPLLFRGGCAVPPGDVKVAGGLLLSLDLDREGYVGYKARRHAPLLDLAKKQEYDVPDFWERVRSEKGGRLILDPEEFYLLISKESVRVPPHLAADMVAYDPTSGELRTHYAGFFDPGFGYSRDGRLLGSRAVLEVRAHDVPFAVEDSQPLAKIAFLRMQAEPAALYGAELGSHFQGQALALSRQFRTPPAEQGVLLDV